VISDISSVKYKKSSPSERSSFDSRLSRENITGDGKSLNLHHLLQTPDGPIVEASISFHKKYYSTIHMNTGQNPSLINRSQFGTWASNYWKNRALDF
jgi:filamentous hemagglutinin